MNSWIDLGAVGRILVVGLLAGAGLPALFAVGLRALAAADDAAESGFVDGTGATRTAVSARRKPLGLVVAGLCFLVVLAAIGYGIDLIVNG
jgi:hypothetical protein